MRTLKLIEYLTLDCIMEDPGPAGDFRHRGWTVPYWNDEMLEAQSKELFTSDTLLLGRVTYDEFVAAWPLRSGDAFTDKMNSMKKVVVSRNPSLRLEWNATLLEGCEEAEGATGRGHSHLRQQDSGSVADAAWIDRSVPIHCVSVGPGGRFSSPCVQLHIVSLWHLFGGKWADARPAERLEI